MKQQGFTLIELLITLAIAAIIGVIAIPSLNERLANTKLKNEAYEVANRLSETRIEAITNRKSASYTISGASITVTPAGKSKTVTYNRNGQSMLGGTVNYKFTDTGASREYSVVVPPLGKVKVISN